MKALAVIHSLETWKHGNIEIIVFLQLQSAEGVRNTE